MEAKDTHGAWIARLSDYLDGELSAGEADRLELHLEGCTECRQTLSELRQVAARARTLTDAPPERDLWPAIASALGVGNARPGRATAPHTARRFSFTLPQLVAASLALMVLSGGMVWLARLGGERTDFPQVAAGDRQAAETARSSGSTTLPVTFADAHYDEAIADLQQTLEADRDRLDPGTVKVLEANLASIDRAIEQCRQALATDPANAYLADRLAAAQKKKLAVLRRATAIARNAGT